METIQVVIDAPLLRATDRTAKRARINRSALVRQALREHLKRLRIAELEERERRGYEQFPEDAAEVERWARVAVWPEP
jgi:metal-responsive CopG/Arc/MetJ family transcriptional regulator